MKRWFLIGAVAWIAAHLLIYFIAPKFVLYGGYFPYKEIANWYNLPPFFSSLANFDGEHYLLIAQGGYNQYEQAFFPLYPILMSLLSVLFAKNYLISGLLISTISFFLGLFVFKLYIQKLLLAYQTHSSTPVWRWAQLFLLIFPTSFFFITIYTESLFFLLMMLTLYFLEKKRYLLSAVFGFLASLSRLIGAFLIIPIGLHLLFSLMQKKHRPVSKQTTTLIISFIAPLLGLGTYMIYLLKTTHDALFFLHAQSAFGANRTSHFISLPQVLFRYIKIFLHSAVNFQYFVSLIEFSIFLLVFGVLLYDLWHIYKNRKHELFVSRLGINLFSLVNIVIPTFTGTLSSIPRYALMSISFFIVLGEIKNNFVKYALLILFAVFHVILFAYFMQGYFVS